MSTREEFLRGKIKWAHVTKPDPKYPENWSLILYPDQESLDKINKLKTGTPAILNELKKDEDGYFITLRRPLSKNIRGQLKAFAPPMLFKEDGTTPLSDTTLIGNGSDVTVGCEVYTYRRGDGLAIRFKTVQVDNLIPFVPQKDFTPEQAEQYGALGEQPKPAF
jgi:hypothetical protein